MLIVGLGNHGKLYENTRHNIGFSLAFLLVKHLSCDNISKSSFKGDLYRKDSTFILFPTTYMNLSGDSLNAVVNFFKLDSFIVIHDDLDIPLGSLRFKSGGGDGGHNGLKSITSYFGNNYPRIRLGIGRPTNGMEVSDFVLSRFLDEEKKQVGEMLSLGLEALIKINSGISFNNVSSLYTKNK